MDEIPAGKVTPTVPMDSPKKNNPIASQSQWSFGWQGGAKDTYNKPNNSKGTIHIIEVSTRITTRAVLFSGGRRRAVGRSRRKPI